MRLKAGRSWPTALTAATDGGNESVQHEGRGPPLGIHAMDDAITIETDMFEHREAKPHFINPCCFGEDFAVWLKREVSPLAGEGFTFSDPIQEDYGWGFWASHGKNAFWVAMSYAGDGPQEPPAQWVVSVSYDAGLNFIKRLFHKPDSRTFGQLRDHVWQSLKSNGAIKVIKS